MEVLGLSLGAGSIAEARNQTILPQLPTDSERLSVALAPRVAFQWQQRAEWLASRLVEMNEEAAASEGAWNEQLAHWHQYKNDVQAEIRRKDMDAARAKQQVAELEKARRIEGASEGELERRASGDGAEIATVEGAAALADVSSELATVQAEVQRKQRLANQLRSRHRELAEEDAQMQHEYAELKARLRELKALITGGG